MPPTAPAKRAPRAAPTRTNDPERTTANILEVATHAFADKGFDGARIDEIAEAMHTSKRMIYYYFGSKEALYLAVLEGAYQRMRAAEATLDLDALPPAKALEALVGFTHDYQLANPDFVRLVANENMLHGAFLKQSKTIREQNASAITTVQRVCERGVRDGVFRGDLDPIDLHMSISALCFFNVANRYTFSLIFERGPTLPKSAVAKRRERIVEMVLRFALK
ncbi:TetR/AcrR family transcriptional regulator [Piscinibacter gummiphilus]|uniref:TetR family transcriptional regulator n=1 Tax=Piscinibacter gummiphilus TaxID=946333 RepID=A0A1W6LEX8_9BURK|nr:TetR/AcrR family transcriptional regulator [Piscinibacter gummiphilus]ARN22790.1 TetR family transcriptional regulator [Piscinibacter gummiphilus]ATU67487.1 TetR/AcrR family transcriptional regulator [Piscinibacter gummiphilus]GLS96600.1 TetR family transcriptional regulator [Piscinibacter gummiphilus]